MNCVPWKWEYDSSSKNDWPCCDLHLQWYLRVPLCNSGSANVNVCGTFWRLGWADKDVTLAIGSAESERVPLLAERSVFC